MRRRIVVLLAMVVMAVAMLAAAAPVFAQGQGFCDPNPGKTEASRSPLSTPPQFKPGHVARNEEADEHDDHAFNTPRAEREECA